MEVQLGDYNIKYEVIRKKNKNMYFRFNDDGVMVITCNRLISDKEIRKLIIKNEKALLRMYKMYLNKKDNDSKYFYLGDNYIVVYDDRIKNVYIEGEYIYTKDLKMLKNFEKSECMRIFKERCEVLLNQFRDIPQFSLKVRKMKTRWGVNNVTKRIITLNSELLKKDVTLIDYVIVHELCHFYEGNHSKRFWIQVEKRYPDYKLARKRLRVE